MDVDGVGPSLVVTVADDGPGGASLEGGTGPRGLAGRVAMLDGAFQVDSPAGGGTTRRAALPFRRPEGYWFGAPYCGGWVW